MSPSLPEDTLSLFNDDSSWFAGAPGLEGYERSFGSPLTFDATEVGLFNGNFVPPPPRPPFLDESAQFDGLTTCGMCSWATKNDLVQANNSSTIDVPGEWSFPVLITIVSLISALVGAFVMVTFLRCRRFKAGNSSGGPTISWWPGGGSDRAVSGGSSSLGHGHRNSGLAKHGGDSIRVPHTPSSNNGVWTWLGQRRVSGGPDPLSQPSSSPAENHYTHMDDSYNAEPGEALYAELDRESIQSGNPSYQNTAYSGCEEADKELQVFSSAPSSAYYSDLSVTTNTIPSHTHGERTYEIVGQNRCPLLESPGLAESTVEHTEFGLNVLSARRHHRLSAINESGGGANTIGGGAGAGQLLHSDFV